MRKRVLRKRLEAQRDQLLQDAAHRILDDSDADIQELVNRADTYSGLLVAVQPRFSRHAVWAVIFAIVSVGLVGYLWGRRATETRITLKAQTESIALRLDKPWRWRGQLPLHTDSVQLEALSEVVSPALFPPLRSEYGEAWIRLQGGEVTLTELYVAQPGTIELDRLRSHTYDFYAREATFTGQLMIGNATQVGLGATPQATQANHTFDQLLVPETIRFQAEGAGAAVPARLHFRLDESWTIRNLPVQGLRFSRQTPGEAGEIAFVSTIRQATLVLHDVDEEVKLQQGDTLSIVGLQGRLVELQIGEYIDLRFEGSAQTLLTGPKGLQKDLAPSLLKCYYHQKPLAFFWSAVGFVWGMLWSIRRTIFQ